MHLSEFADHHHGGHHRHGAQCGCRHTVEPETLNKSLSASHVTATILAIGVRPCSGALIVLVFALSQKLFLAGVLSTIAMGIGAGSTVSALAVFATMARQTALRAAGTGSFWAAGAVRAMGIGGALTMLAFGSVMLAGALAT